VNDINTKANKTRSSRPGLLVCALVLAVMIPALSFRSVLAQGAVPSPEKQADNRKPDSEPLIGAIFDPDKIEIEKYDFGVVTCRRGPVRLWSLHPVVVIPNLPGIQYAWRLKIKPPNPVFVREEFTLPEAPSSWKIKQGESSSELLKGGEQCVLEGFQSTDQGWLGHSWSASRGDPPGKYEIKIILNGKLAHTFTFNVGEPLDFEKHGRDI
jgi:hypothetical protein